VSEAFTARRVDQHNLGGLLASEIIAFIEGSDIIVADLTNERPNCYLEVGYALGAGRSSHVVLTAREDDNPDSPNHSPGGPKIHFDLAGYHILFWAPKLPRRVPRRTGEARDSSPTAPGVNIEPRSELGHPNTATAAGSRGAVTSPQC
jgi:hypothetical protein